MNSLSVQSAESVRTSFGRHALQPGAWAAAHPALARVRRLLAQQSPTLSQRADAALEVVLEGVYQSRWPEVAWEFSRLTGGGFPLELTFSSADETIRYAAEVAGPELAETARLSRAGQLLARLGTQSPAATVMAALTRIQAAGPLRYGAWIGGRHGRSGDGYKLYAEVPRTGAPEADALVQQLLGPEPLLSQRTPQLVMIGYEPAAAGSASARLEFYFRVAGLEPWEVGGLLRRINLAGRALELLALVEETYGRSLERGLPGARLGFSFSVGLNGAGAAFSVFNYAGVVCGGDKSIRRRLLELARTKGWDFAAYELLSEPLAERNVWMTYHTMMTFGVAAAEPPVLRIGLRPPEPQVSL